MSGNLYIDPTNGLKRNVLFKIHSAPFGQVSSKKNGIFDKKVKCFLNPLGSFVLAPLPECHQVFTQQILLSHKYRKETLTINMCHFEQ